MHYIYDSGYVNLFENDKYYQSFLSTLSRNTLSTFIKDEKVIDEILNISDNEGNVIAELKGGHIKTKNFDDKIFSFVHNWQYLCIR